MNSILLFPAGKDAHGRMTYSGIEFPTLNELDAYYNNIGGFNNAIILVNGTTYDVTDIKQAKADNPRS